MRRFLSAVAVALLGTLAVAAEKKMFAFPFTLSDVGKEPSGWTADQTGKGQGSVWKIEADPTAPSTSGCVVAQTSESPNAVFNLCVANDTNFRNVEIRVAFKAVRGKNDQGGGVVWRYQDPNNYYVARMNPLEDNLRVYKVVAGKRTQLASQEGLKIPAGEWHTLKVKQKDDHIECALDDKKYLDIQDKTFSQSGKIGLWTKSDAQTYFDDLVVGGK